MEIGFTTVEIILGIYATVMATLLGLLVYFVTKELSNKELAKDIGTVKAHSESTEKILREVKTDVKALVSKVDKNTESLNSKVESVNDSVDKKAESLRTELQENRKESVIAHQQICSNIDSLRLDSHQDVSELRKDISGVQQGIRNVESQLLESNARLEKQLTESNARLEKQLLESNARLENQISESNAHLEKLIIAALKSKDDDSTKTD